MSAPENAEPIGVSDENETLPKIKCEGCGWRGKASELLGVDPDDDPTLWYPPLRCPNCRSSHWVYVP